MTYLSKPALAVPALALALAACAPPNGGKPDQSESESVSLLNSSIGGPFTLTDTGGKTVRWSDFDGKYRIVYFGYTYCPDVCPTDVAKIMKAYDALRKDDPAKAAEIQPIFISVDPARDTPAVLAEFLGHFPSGMIGLTGTEEEVKAAVDAFKVYVEKGEATGDGGYLVNHTNATYLMGRDGKPLALLPVDESPKHILAEIEKWTS